MATGISRWLVLATLFASLLLAACGGEEETKSTEEDRTDTPLATAEVTKEAKESGEQSDATAMSDTGVIAN